MSEHDKGPGVRVPPPFIYLAGFLVGWLLQLAFALPSLDGPLDLILGLALIVAGSALAFPSARLFFRAGTNLAPHRPTTALVFDGPYRFTRNPIYVGFALIYAGAAIWSGITWALIVLPAVLFVVATSVIAREERYLESTFGDEYLNYKSRVRRWL